MVFSVALQEAGRFSSSVEPLKKGPRHCGQSLAGPDEAEIRITVIRNNAVFEYVICWLPFRSSKLRCAHGLFGWYTKTFSSLSIHPMAWMMALGFRTVSGLSAT